MCVIWRKNEDMIVRRHLSEVDFVDVSDVPMYVR